jgi:hypothetical protein
MFHNGGLLKTAEAEGDGAPLAMRLLVQPDADVIVKISVAHIENDKLPAQLQQVITGMVTGLSSAQRRIDAARRVTHSAVALVLGGCGIGVAYTAPDPVQGSLEFTAFLALGAVMRMLRGPVLGYVLQRALR